MHTYQIADTILSNYKSAKLSDERVEFLKKQAEEQLEELATNAALYERFLKKIDAPETLDRVFLWMLLMSNEDICCDYIDEFSKKFREIIPVSDIADLLTYAIYLAKIEKKSLMVFHI